jgi:hypothetical protein
MAPKGLKVSMGFPWVLPVFTYWHENSYTKVQWWISNQ